MTIQPAPLLKRYPLATFFLLTYALSWLAAGLLLTREEDTA